MLPRHRFQKKKDTLGREMPNGEMVLVQTDSGECFTVNAVGAVLWNSLPSVWDLEVCEALLSRHYPDIDPRLLREDARSFVDDLRSSGFVIEAP